MCIRLHDVYKLENACSILPVWFRSGIRVGECGICGWIKTSKEKHRRKQDYNEPADPGGGYQGDAGDNEEMEDEEQ